MITATQYRAFDVPGTPKRMIAAIRSYDVEKPNSVVVHFTPFSEPFAWRIVLDHAEAARLIKELAQALIDTER